ncbi:unnamed protein product [Urochloa decumbens]|uniref:DWNN domain-containing protein n=1 Tax=Urochloa decumbens TaxID=240449 RepID=A0ABC8WSE7_9POAL
MAVYYRYKSGVQTFSVPVAAPSVTVADLKNLILATPRQGHGRTRGRGPRETLALYDERTGDEFTDGGALIHRNSTVLVRRIAGPPAEAITVATSPSDSAVTSSSSAEDDEARAIDAVIDAAQLKWEGQHQYQGGRRYGTRGALVGMAPPPAGYVCHRCRVPGHFIQHCPTNGDPRYDMGRAPPSNTILPPPSPAVSSSSDDGVPLELHCKICTKVMSDAVVASRCCFGSFCDACAREQIAAKSRCVCGAASRADDLIPNLTLRATISKLLAKSAAASSGPAGTENRKSSAGSNAEPTTSQGAATSKSKESGSRVTAAAGSEHSEGSASSTSKIAAAPAAREARTKRTTAKSAETTGAHAGYPEQYGYGNAFGPACYDPFFGAAPWACDPYMYYGMPYGGGYMDVPAAAGHGRKRRADGEFQRHAEAGFKRRCAGRSEVAF